MIYNIYKCRIFYMTTFQKVIDHFGGVSKAAKALGVTYQAVCFWRDGERKIPEKACIDIERETSGKVRCEDLRPDVDWNFLRNTKKKAA